MLVVEEKEKASLLLFLTSDDTNLQDAGTMTLKT